MATLQENKEKLLGLRAQQKERFDKIKAAEDNGVKAAIIEEVRRAEDEMKSLHDTVVQEQTLAEQERANAEAMEKLKESKSAIPFSSQDAVQSPTGDPVGNTASKNIGDIFAESDELKAFIENKGRQQSQGREIDEFKSLKEAFYPHFVQGDGSTKDATPFTSSGLTGYFRPPGVVLQGVQIPRIAQLLPQGTINMPTVRYVREVSFTPAATTVAEGIAKPEATWDLEEVDAPVRKIAVWTKMSDESIADFGYVRDYINQRLPLMVEIEEDDQLLNGLGTGTEIRGILHTSGVLQHSLGYDVDETTPVTGDTAPDAILRGLTRVVAESYFEPTGLTLNPFDWMNIRLLRSGTGDSTGGETRGQYLFGSPSDVGIATLWGLPVVTTTRLAQGTAVGGAWNLGAQILRRMGISMQVTNTDQDDFIKNLVTFRVEERLAFPIYRPQAFVVIDLNPSAGSGSGSG